jgi:aminoacrylate hydrolase
MNLSSILTAGTFAVETADGAVLHGCVEGEGRSLLLVSGLGGSAGFWDRNVPQLAQTFRVIRFNQRGIASSTRGSAVCTIAQLAQDCLNVLDATGTERAVLLGHSTGGCIGQALARQARERLSGLILSATWHKPSRYMAALFGTRRDILNSDPKGYAATAALMAYPPAWLEANWAIFESALSSAPATELARLVVQERIDALLAFDSSTFINSLDIPIFVLGARDDVIVPPFLQENLAEALPRCRKMILENGGHFFPISRPDVFTACVADWIGSLADSG